jgi:hypothetical protein
MTDYPKPFGLERYAATLQGLQAAVKQLQTRTAVLDSGFPLACLPGQIDPAYTTGDPHAFVNGSATLTGPYQHLAAYTPVASDSVLLIPVPALQTYVVAGRLT